MTKWISKSLFLETTPDSEVLEEMALAMAQATIQHAANASHLNRADLAAKMGRPRSFISRMLRGDHNLTIRTFARALASCGYELKFSYVPIQSTAIETLQIEECKVSSGNAQAAAQSDAGLGLAA